MSRKGYTLIEIMVVMSIASVVMGVSAGWIHQSMKAGSIMRDRGRQHQSLLRLSRSLRTAVWQGKTIRMDGDDSLAIIHEDGQVVTFKIASSAVEMQSRRSDGQLVQDSFAYSSQVTVHWDTTKLPDAITLVAIRKAPHEAVVPLGVVDRPVELCVQASPNRWHQLGVQQEVDQ